MTQFSALVIDDEPDICELLQLTLERMDIATKTASNVNEALSSLDNGTFNICLTDLKLPDGTGIDIVKHIHANQPNLPVAVITAHGNMDTAILALKEGAFDFISKPVDLANLRTIVSKAIDSNQHTPEAVTPNTRILGKSSAIAALQTQIVKLARSQAPVYISGESGSGKELVARSIHELGPRADAPFIPVNCGAIPSELMESEFFGHKKGSFTGAHQDKAGLFKNAEGGTLFLDEVADLPLDMQVKLLRAIQEKAIRAVGASTETVIDVRILCATHKDLEKEVVDGNFRQDLFYRLNVIQVKVPALRERKEDIPLLSEHILHKLANSCGLPCPKLSDAAVKELSQYEFPGNVRELENILERAFTLCDSKHIGPDDLQLQAASRPLDTTPKGEHRLATHFTRCAEYPSIDDYLAEIEKEALLGALEKVRWNKTLAAKELGITFRSLRYRLQKLGLESD